MQGQAVGRGQCVRRVWPRSGGRFSISRQPLDWSGRQALPARRHAFSRVACRFHMSIQDNRTDGAVCRTNTDTTIEIHDTMWRLRLRGSSLVPHRWVSDVPCIVLVRASAGGEQEQNPADAVHQPLITMTSESTTGRFGLPVAEESRDTARISS